MADKKRASLRLERVCVVFNHSTFRIILDCIIRIDENVREKEREKKKTKKKNALFFVRKIRLRR